MRTIIAAINLVLTTGFGALRIWKVSKEDLPIIEKIKRVRDELAKIIGKLEALAASTPPEWDDTLANALSGVLEAVATAIIEQLEGGTT